MNFILHSLEMEIKKEWTQCHEWGADDMRAPPRGGTRPHVIQMCCQSSSFASSCHGFIINNIGKVIVINLYNTMLKLSLFCVSTATACAVRSTYMVLICVHALQASSSTDSCSILRGTHTSRRFNNWLSTNTHVDESNLNGVMQPLIIHRELHKKWENKINEKNNYQYVCWTLSWSCQLIY